jgi:arginyl-tRNA synthetase
MAKKDGLLMYKGYPLVRNGKTIYYGNSYDPFVVMIQIASTKQSGDLEIADKVLIQLLNTDPDVRPRDRIVKKSEKKGLYAAMDIAEVWLTRANAGK